MARIHETAPKIVASTKETHEKVFNVDLTQEQLYDALFTWLRIKGIQLPSKAYDKYVVGISGGKYDYAIGCNNKYEVNITHTTIEHP